MRLGSALIALTALATGAGETAAQPAAAPWVAISEQATFLTGDTWTQGDTSFRLYGVQSCLRSTFFTNAHGIKRDCGEASATMLIALIRDLKPQCATVAAMLQPKTNFVYCLATLTQGQHAGVRIDLGTALISSGFAFAALTPAAKPVHEPYFVAQLVAQKARAGLWQFPDAPDPNAAILRAIQAAAPPQPAPAQPNRATPR